MILNIDLIRSSLVVHVCGDLKYRYLSFLDPKKVLKIFNLNPKSGSRLTQQSIQ